MTGIRLRQESTLKDDEIEWEKKTAMLFLECLSGRSLREAKVDPVHLTVYLFLHGVLWAMPAQKADPMGDIVLTTFMGHGWTIL